MHIRPRGFPTGLYHQITTLTTMCKRSHYIQGTAPQSDRKPPTMNKNTQAFPQNQVRCFDVYRLQEVTFTAATSV